MGLSMTELIQRVGGDDAIEWQNLFDCLIAARTRKGGITEISFGTTQVAPTQIMNGTQPKVGIVLWMDKAETTKAIENWKREQRDADPS